jgi:hypothetical protein
MTRPAVMKLEISGNAFERGVQHGSQARDLVRKGVDFYVNMWEQNTGKSRAEVLELAGKFAEPIREFDARNWPPSAAATAQPDTIPRRPRPQRPSPRPDRAGRRGRARGDLRVRPPTVRSSPALVSAPGARVRHRRDDMPRLRWAHADHRRPHRRGVDTPLSTRYGPARAGAADRSRPTPSTARIRLRLIL